MTGLNLAYWFKLGSEHGVFLLGSPCSSCDVRVLITPLGCLRSSAAPLPPRVPAAARRHRRENFGSRRVELLAATLVCWQELPQQDAGEQGKISPCFCKLANETLNKLLNSVSFCWVKRRGVLGNLRDLNWPERAKNTFFPPQALLLSFQYIWLAQWQIIFITLQKLYSSRKTGCVPCLTF